MHRGLDVNVKFGGHVCLSKCPWFFLLLSLVSLPSAYLGAPSVDKFELTSQLLVFDMFSACSATETRKERERKKKKQVSTIPCD